MARDWNSVPLSTRMDLGKPRSAATASKQTATLTPVMEKAGSKARHSRVYWSTRVSTRKYRPFSSRLVTKSMLHRSLGASAAGNRIRLRLANRRRFFVLMDRSISRYRRYTSFLPAVQPSRRRSTVRRR